MLLLTAMLQYVSQTLSYIHHSRMEEQLLYKPK